MDGMGVSKLSAKVDTTPLKLACLSFTIVIHLNEAASQTFIYTIIYKYVYVCAQTNNL